jgi:hypothetical protein
MRKKLNIAFYVGDLPAPTFINRLAVGLVEAGVILTMFGLIKKKFTRPKGIKFSGAIDGEKEGRNSRYARFVKFSMLMVLFRKTDKKNLTIG